MLAPFFLAGIVAIGLPLWLHRIAREERIRLPFASLMLLEASEVRDTSRRSLRYLVLLALRIVFIVVLALAFAGPLVKPNALVGNRPAELHAIVLDGSLSMQYLDRWERAQERARELIDGLKNNDRALLVWASGRKIDLVAGPVFAVERGVLHGALATLKPNLDRLDYGSLMTSSRAWLTVDAAPAHLHLITDVQASAAPLNFADLQAPPNTRMQVHAVSDAVRDNVTVVAIELHGAHERTLTVNLQGVSERARGREVVVFVDEREIARKPVAAALTFGPLPLKSGAHRLRVSVVPSDALPQDDHYFAVIEHAAPSVLLVTRDAKSDAAAYLAAAIESQDALPLTVVHATPNTLATTALTQYAAVVIADSGILDAADAKRIAQYGAAGGATFITLGPQAARLEREPITGFEIRRIVANEQRVAQVDDSHPVLRDARGWRAVRFLRHIVVTPVASDRVLLTLEDGSPLLIERPHDVERTGRTLLLAAPLDREWNDLGIHPLFVRFIADAVRHLTGRDAMLASHVIGAQVATGIVSGSGGQIFNPDGERVLAMSELARASRFVPEQVGFYEVRSGQHTRWVAVNTDRRESALAPMSAESVRRWETLTSVPEVAPVATTTSAELPRRSIGGDLLLLAAALLLSELLLGNHRLTIRRDGTPAGKTREVSNESA